MPIANIPNEFPQRFQPEETFNANMAEYMAWMPGFVSDFTAMCDQASTDAANALAAASGAANTKWISGATYAIGDRRWSPITYGDYRRKTVGAGTTDPSLDTTNWASTFSMAAPIFTGLTTTGSLKIADAAARITADFTTATYANRTMFQSSTPNSNSNVAVIPNGTGTGSSFNASNNSGATNASEHILGISATSAFLNSFARGSGTALPFEIIVGGASRFSISTAGAASFGETVSTGGDITCGAGMILKSYTVATRPAHATGKAIFVTDAGPGSKVQVSDGTNWTFAGDNQGAPLYKTADFTVGFGEGVFTCAKTSSCVVTLPTPSSNRGRTIKINSNQAFTVVSASANVVPLAGGAATTSILAGTAGKWATLTCDGTSWIITQAN